MTHDVEICIGCYSCVGACPYGAPQKNEINSRMVKCDLCAWRLDNGDTPACVLACPMKVIEAGEIADFEAKGAVREAAGFALHSTEPNIRFVPLSM